jgi:hypothetical protein
MTPHERALEPLALVREDEQAAAAPLGVLHVSFRVDNLPLNALHDGRRVSLDSRGLRIDRRCLETCHCRFRRTHAISDHAATQLLRQRGFHTSGDETHGAVRPVQLHGRAVEHDVRAITVEQTETIDVLGAERSIEHDCGIQISNAGESGSSGSYGRCKSYRVCAVELCRGFMTAA